MATSVPDGWDFWFSDAADCEQRTGSADDAESIALGRDPAGQMLMVSRRRLLSREEADADEFTYGPSSMVVHAVMRTAQLGFDLPDDLARLAAEGGPARRAGFAIGRISIGETVLIGAAKRFGSLWAVCTVHDGTWVLTISPHQHPRLRHV